MRVSCTPPLSASFSTMPAHWNVEPSSSLVVSVGRIHSGRGQFEHPANVTWHHEVPCGSHDMCAKNGAIAKKAIELGVRDSLGPLCHSPLRGSEVLCLHGAQQTHDLLRTFSTRTDQALVVEALCGDARARHWRPT